MKNGRDLEHSCLQPSSVKTQAGDYGEGVHVRNKLRQVENKPRVPFQGSILWGNDGEVVYLRNKLRQVEKYLFSKSYNTQVTVLHWDTLEKELKQEPEPEPEPETTEKGEGSLLAGYCSASFLIQPGVPCLGMVPPTVGWALLYKLAIKKNAFMVMSIGPSDQGKFLSWD